MIFVSACVKFLIANKFNFKDICVSFGRVGIVRKGSAHLKRTLVFR